MSKKGLEQNKLFLSLKQLYKAIESYFGPKKRILAKLIFGITIIIIIVIFIWWNWDKISHLPGVNSFISWYSEEPLPQVDTNYFTVLVAHLENDKEREIENLIIESLKELKGIHPRQLHRNIRIKDAFTEETEQQGHKQARSYLQKTGAQVLIWGTVIRASGKSIPKLYLTVSERIEQKKPYERYQLTENLSLPVTFWEDLADILRLLIIIKNTQFHAAQGKYINDEINPFIEKVRRILKYQKEKPGWTDREYANIVTVLADCQLFLGEQSGKSEPLEAAISAYREALKEYTRERDPLNWARLRSNLGSSLLLIGRNERGTKCLEEAVIAYRDALKEQNRKRIPLEWATTQSNLVSALAMIGRRERGTKHLEEALIALQEALKEQTRERVPLEWAMTQSNMGNILLILGQRGSGTKRLEEAVVAYHEALKEYTRERFPRYWAMTQSNMGGALEMIGRRESGTKRLEEAVAACHEALKEQTRERVPLEWAMTQNNLGNALLRLGERESGTTRLEEAVIAFRDTLKENTRESVPLAWAATQNNLHLTLEIISKKN